MARVNHPLDQLLFFDYVLGIANVTDTLTIHSLDFFQEVQTETTSYQPYLRILIINDRNQN